MDLIPVITEYKIKILVLQKKTYNVSGEPKELLYLKI
jgi:hypothetical protein